MVSILPGVTYFPFLVHMVITRRCNLACGYCSEYDKTSSPVPLPVLKRQVDRLKQLGACFLTITGGEPLLHPELFDLLNYARGKFLVVGMITNGYLLTEEAVQKMKQAGLSSIQISIDGVNRNNTTLKALKPLKSKLEMVAREAKFSVTLNSVVGSAPLPDILEIFQFARSHRLYSLIQVIHDARGQIIFPAGNRAAYKKIVKNFRIPIFNLSWGQTRRLMLKGKAPFKCRAGSRYLYINEFGEVCWCSRTQDRFHKPLEEYTHDDLKTQFYTRKDCEDLCTLGCARITSTPEWFRRYAQENPSV
jgi:MoaA/NifB/PqqE/SkfB family radical SAM enzyme